MIEPVITFGQAVVDDSLKRNVNFQGKSGLSPRVVTSTSDRKSMSDGVKRWQAVIHILTYPMTYTGDISDADA